MLKWLAALAALANRFGDFFHVVRNLGNQNHIRSARNARAERQPTGAMSHDFHDHDAMMTVGRAVQAIDRFGRNPERGVETERHVGHGDVVVDRLGQRDDVEPFFFQMERVLLRAAAAEADERIEVKLFVIGDDRVGHVHFFSADQHPIRFLATRAENGSADRENPRKRFAIQFHGAVLHQARESRRGSRSPPY